MLTNAVDREGKKVLAREDVIDCQWCKCVQKVGKDSETQSTGETWALHEDSP